MMPLISISISKDLLEYGENHFHGKNLHHFQENLRSYNFR